MRIAFVEQTVTHTFGGTRRIVELANTLVALGHRVDVYTKLGQQARWIPLRVKVKAWPALKKDGPFDLVLFNQSKPEELNLVRNTTTKLRAFYVLGWGETRLDEIEREIKSAHPGPALQVVRSVFDDPKFVILACSTWIGEHLRARYRRDTVTLLGGINREHFRPYQKPDDGKLRIYYSGDPRSRKGTDTVVAAIREMRTATKRKTTTSTYWRKGIPQLRMGVWYSSATIFADGQHWAGWNNPVLEAMACKTPVVCTDISGVRDFAVDGETALLVPPKDVKAMSHALMRLTRSEALRKQLADAGYERVRGFTWEETAARLIEIVRERL